MKKIVFCENNKIRFRRKIKYPSLEYFNLKNKYENDTFYVSNNFYDDKNRLIFNNLFFDFDAESSNIEDLEIARYEVLKVYTIFKRKFGVRGCFHYTGNRGFHLLIYHKKIIIGNKFIMKKVLEYLYKSLIEPLNLKTLDKKVFTNLEGLRRPINVKNKKSGLYCIPLTSYELIRYDIRKIKDLATRKRIIFSNYNRSIKLEKYLKSKFDFLKDFYEEVSAIIKSELKNELDYFYYIPNKENNKVLRPCIEKFINDLKPGGYWNHSQRLAILFELINQGYTDDEILSIFSNLEDFDRNKTLYQIKFARKKGYKKYLCIKLAKILEVDCKDCYIYQKYGNKVS